MRNDKLLKQKRTEVAYKDLQVGDKFTYENELFVKHKDGINSEEKPFGLSWSLRNGREYKEWAFGLNDIVIKQN